MDTLLIVAIPLAVLAMAIAFAIGRKGVRSHQEETVKTLFRGSSTPTFIMAMSSLFFGSLVGSIVMVFDFDALFSGSSATQIMSGEILLHWIVSFLGGTVIVLFYAVPVFYFLGQRGLAGPLSVIVAAVAPAAMALLFGVERPIPGLLALYGASVGLTWAILVYRHAKKVS